MDCASLILSQDTYDFIFQEGEPKSIQAEPVCRQPIDGDFGVLYYDRSRMPALSVGTYSYTAIPKCYYLTDTTALDISGITAIQNNPTLSLTGQGVFIGIIDTGIDYTNRLFRREDGGSRIVSIWDQGAVLDQGDVPEYGDISNQGDISEHGNIIEKKMSLRFLYGIEYTQEELDQALRTANPQELVPTRDDNGHGTFLASVAAGGRDAGNDFVGAAPDSELIIVKLKEAKEYLREYFYVPKDVPAYQENDIMAGIAYISEVARAAGRPVVILLGMGTNQGSHAGSGPLGIYSGQVGSRSGHCIVYPTGNEAEHRGHYFGQAKSVLTPERVEIDVTKEIDGFCMEVWSFAPEQVRIVVQSPTGQQSQGGFPVTEETQSTRFVFENTFLTIDYRVVGRRRGDLLVFLRFSNVAKGIWTLLVYPENSITGAFHIWLPMDVQGEGRLTFLKPNPDTTLTEPSASEVTISVGAYNGVIDGSYGPSGRGYSAVGMVKPELVAPGVDVMGLSLRGNYEKRSGTSVAAAITAGAAALVLQWGVRLGNAPGMNSVEVKNTLIRGLRRDENRDYPNVEQGFGKLDMYNSFLILR